MITDDNFLSDNIKNLALNVVLDKKIPWSFYPKSIYDNDNNFGIISNENTEEWLQFISMLRHNDTIFLYNKQFSIYDFMHNEIFVPFLQKHNIVCNSIYRVKLNLVTKYKESIHQTPHIDMPVNHKVFLYYFNDSDGDTIMYNEKWDGTEKTLTENCRISPKMGKAILFDGLTYHAPSNPVNSDFRIVMNIDFV